MYHEPKPLKMRVVDAITQRMLDGHLTLEEVLAETRANVEHALHAQSLGAGGRRQSEQR